MPETGQRLDKPAAVAWLSLSRYERYATAAAGDHAAAIDLYLWNSQVAAAGLVEVGHLEVALRNAYDRHLTTKFPTWTTDAGSRLFRQEQGVPKARTRQRTMNQKSLALVADAKRGLGASPTHGEVVATLMFGFWASLTRHERASLFWNPMLHHAFPKGTKRSHVHELVSRVVKFRNRLAHNEPVFSTRTGLYERLNEVRELFGLVSPDADTFVSATSQIPELAARCPVQGLLAAT